MSDAGDRTLSLLPETEDLEDHGHLSNENAGRLLNCVLHDRLKRFFWDISARKNNYEELAYETVRLEIDEETAHGASDFSISVASRTA